MNGNDASQPHAKETQTSPAPSPSTTADIGTQTEAPPIAAWRKYVHLYLPLIASAFQLVLAAIGANSRDAPEDGESGSASSAVLIIAASAVLTYLLGSLVYPANRPDPSPEEAIRFTRKNDLYRVAVLFTYGRLYGTPFNLAFFISDVVCSFLADSLIGERDVGTKPRRSEFFVAALWVAGSSVASLLLPFLDIVVGVADRTLWRTAYIALVDDVIGVLTRPNVRTVRGNLTLVLVQAFTILSLVGLGLSWMRRMSQQTPDMSFEAFLAQNQLHQQLVI